MPDSELTFEQRMLRRLGAKGGRIFPREPESVEKRPRKELNALVEEITLRVFGRSKLDGLRRHGDGGGRKSRGKNARLSSPSSDATNHGIQMFTAGDLHHLCDSLPVL